MGPVHYNCAAHRSIHEAWHIAHDCWLNHTGYCRKALDWLLMADGLLLTMRSSWLVVNNEVIVAHAE